MTIGLTALSVLAFHRFLFFEEIMINNSVVMNMMSYDIYPKITI